MSFSSFSTRISFPKSNNITVSMVPIKEGRKDETQSTSSSTTTTTQKPSSTSATPEPSTATTGAPFTLLPPLTLPTFPTLFPPITTASPSTTSTSASNVKEPMPPAPKKISLKKNE